MVADRVFEVKVDITKSVATFAPVTEGLSTLKWPYDLALIEIYQRDSGEAVMLYPNGDKSPVPAGEYCLRTYRMTKTFKKGGRWQVVAFGSPDGQVVTAKAGKSVDFPFGEPFAPKVSAYMSAPGQTQLAFDVLGSAGERVAELRLIRGPTDVPTAKRDKQLPAEPTYRIISAEGEVVHSGTFEYG